MARGRQNLDPCLPQWLPREPSAYTSNRMKTHVYWCLDNPLVLQSWALIHSWDGRFGKGPSPHPGDLGTFRIGMAKGTPGERRPTVCIPRKARSLPSYMACPREVGWWLTWPAWLPGHLDPLWGQEENQERGAAPQVPLRLQEPCKSWVSDQSDQSYSARVGCTESQGPGWHKCGWSFSSGTSQKARHSWRDVGRLPKGLRKEPGSSPAAGGRHQKPAPPKTRWGSQSFGSTGFNSLLTFLFVFPSPPLPAAFYLFPYKYTFLYLRICCGLVMPLF